MISKGFPVQPVQRDYSIYRNVVNELLTGNEQLPSLPDITFEIRRALEHPDISFLSLSKLLVKDPSLAAILLKYASSPLVSTQAPPQHLLDVVRVLGMNQVERITMAHSVKSLFTMHSIKHKKLFVEAWRRIALKASVSTYIAKHMGRISPDHALLGALLSEVGTLAVLSAFKNSDKTPDIAIYVALCREYSKSLGIIMLKKWQVDNEYINVIRQAGNWMGESTGALNLCDIINLGLYHSIKLRYPERELPDIKRLTAYQKLYPPQNILAPSGGLAVVMTHLADIRILARTLFQH